MRKTKEAFRWIIKILEENKIPYRVSGGFAARIYGSKRPLFDIDIEIPDSKFKKILPKIKNYIVHGPKKFKDKTMNVFGLSMMFKSQQIDLSGTEKEILFDIRSKKWVKSKIDLSKITRKKVYGKIVNVIRKKDLIEYKNKIRRPIDIEDIRQMD